MEAHRGIEETTPRKTDLTVHVRTPDNSYTYAVNILSRDVASFRLISQFYDGAPYCAHKADSNEGGPYFERVPMKTKTLR